MRKTKIKLFTGLGLGSIYKLNYRNSSKVSNYNESKNNIQYHPINITIDKTKIQNKMFYGKPLDYNSSVSHEEMEFKNYTRPFLKALVDNKDKILNILGREEIKISSDIYNEIVPVTFGIYGVESGMGNINPELVNIVLGIFKLYNPDKYKTNPDIIIKYYSYSIIKDIEIDYNNEKKNLV